MLLDDAQDLKVPATNEHADLLAVEHAAVAPAPAPGGALFTLPGASEGTTQWRVERLQLVNWGGFEGLTTLAIHPGSTLLSGASGTGKSTLLDAYTALMMPSDVPFNGASADTVGRSRGTEQRSLVSYLRGQTDTTADVEGDLRAEVLRGDGSATWGAVAMTFVSDRGQAFTAARLYYVPASARLGGDVAQRMVTFDGRLDMADFAAFAAEQFIPAKLRAHAPGLVAHDSYQAFAARLFTRLGIGANGDGDKALRLLARVQAGHQIRTVDALYKEMVLERPATYAAADQALTHFDALADTYHRMQAEYRKLQLLEPITVAWDRLAGARSTIAQIDTFGVSAPGASPLTLWSLRREADMVETAVAANRAQRPALDQHAQAAKEIHADLRDQLDALEREHTQAGGGALQVLQRQIEEADQEAATRQIALNELTSRLGALVGGADVDLSDPAVFADMVAQGDAFRAGYTAACAPLREQLDRLNPRTWALRSDISGLDAELRSLSGRQTKIPTALVGLRDQVCAATGLAAEDLPFLAELVDVHPDQAAWRTAIETVLGAPARLMLVPAEYFEAFSHGIDPLKVRGVLRFAAATLHRPDAPAAPADTVAGKLVFKDSPFRGWVSEYVTAQGRNAVCVDSPTALAGPGLRVTAAGQTRRGTQGSHGRFDARNIIGFTNLDTIADLTAQRDRLDAQLAGLSAEGDDLTAKLARLAGRNEAFLVLSGASFTQIDVRSPRDRSAQLTTTGEKLLAGNDHLQELQDHLTRLRGQVDEANTAAVLTRAAVRQHEEAWTGLVERKDLLVDQVLAIEDAQQVVLTDDQTTALDAHLTAGCLGDDPGDLDRWGHHLAALHNRLLGAQDAARTEEDRTRRDLERIFELYLDQFPDPNLGRAVDSYPDFARILDQVRSVGLHERRAEWRDRLMKWSGQDLVPLAQAMTSAVEDIKDRLDPINDILRRLPFGATSDRLFMAMRRLTRDQVVGFRRQLSRLSSGATAVLRDEQMEARFRELEAFMATLRSAKDPRYDAKVSARDDLLDVRRHVEIHAERRGEGGQLLSTYTSLGSKSGGETQELIAFIVGAALRFRLGDEDRARPRFAPVFLDEGFIRADAEFASRAVQAWTGLGFQLIVGAPLDKVAALEPHMDAFLLVTKNLRRKRARVRPISDADRAEARRDGPRADL